MGEINVYCIQCPSCGNVLDFLGKDEVVCQHCKNKVYRSKETPNVNMKFEYAFVSDGASYKDKFNEAMKKLGDFSGEYNANLYSDDMDISKFIKKINTEKFTVKSVKKKIDAVELAKLEGLIQRLHFEYGGENASKVLTSDKILRGLIKEINAIDENNIYTLFIEKFVFMRSLSYDELKVVFTRKDALEIAEYILPFLKIKELRDGDICKLVCLYVLNTSVSDDKKWQALKSVLGTRQKLPYAEFANVFKAVINFDLDLIALSEFEKLFNGVCLSKITSLNEKLDALHAIRSSTLLPNIKTKFYISILSTANDYYEDFESAMCYLTFISKLTELDEVVKQELMIKNVVLEGEKIVNFTKKFTLEQRLSVVNMLCFGKVLNTQTEDFVRFVYNALTQDIYSDRIPLADEIKIFDLISRIDSCKKAEKTKNLLLIEVAKSFNFGKDFETISYLNYINTAKVDNVVKREVYVSVISSAYYKPNTQQAMAMFDYIFNLDAEFLNANKNELLKYILANKIEVFESFSELDGLLRYLYHLKEKEDVKSEFILSLLKKGERQQNIVLSFEGIVSFVKYFDDEIMRLKYLFPLYITYRDELFYSLKPLLILYAQGVLNKSDMALAFKVIKCAKMPKIEPQNKALIYTTIDEYAKEYQVEELSKNNQRKLKPQMRVLKYVSLDKNYEDGKVKPELAYDLHGYYVEAESYGLVEAKVKLAEVKQAHEKYFELSKDKPSKGKKLARVIVSAFMMIFLPILIILCAPYFSSVAYTIVLSIFVAIIYLLLLVKIVKDYRG